MRSISIYAPCDANIQHDMIAREMNTSEKGFTGVTLRGLPVHIVMDWPFHHSAGGSDWYVVHGRIYLADGGDLHADVALNLSQTIREALPALDSDLAFWVSINTARKALDDRQLELLKSGKRQPVPVSSRSYSIRHRHFTFWTATSEQVSAFVASKVFWLSDGRRQPALIADPCDAQYLGAADPGMMDKLLVAAKDLGARSMLELGGEYARATDELLEQSSAFHAAKDHALAELAAKHAFERGSG